MSSPTFYFDTHPDHLFCCSQLPNPLGFQMSFPSTAEDHKLIQSPVNAWAICVAAPGLIASVGENNIIHYTPEHDKENVGRWEYSHSRITKRVHATWIHWEGAKYLAGVCLFLFDEKSFGELGERDVKEFLEAIRDQDFIQKVTGRCLGYLEDELKVVGINPNTNIVYVKVGSKYEALIFNENRYRFEVLNARDSGLYGNDKDDEDVDREDEEEGSDTVDDSDQESSEDDCSIEEKSEEDGEESDFDEEEYDAEDEYEEEEFEREEDDDQCGNDSDIASDIDKEYPEGNSDEKEENHSGQIDYRNVDDEEDPITTPVVLFTSNNVTVIRNADGFLEKYCEGSLLPSSTIFEHIPFNPNAQWSFVTPNHPELPSDSDDEMEEEEEDERDFTVYGYEDIPMVEHEEEVMAVEFDYFQRNEIVTDSASTDDDDEIIVVD